MATLNLQSCDSVQLSGLNPNGQCELELANDEAIVHHGEPLVRAELIEVSVDIEVCGKIHSVSITLLSSLHVAVNIFADEADRTVSHQELSTAIMTRAEAIRAVVVASVDRIVDWRT